MLPGIAGLVGLIGEAKSVSFRESHSAAGSASSYTVSAADLGAPSGSRRVVVAVSSLSTSTPTVSVTINGVSATEIITRRRSPSNVALYIAHVPNDATGDISVTFGVTTTMRAVGIWALYGLESSTPLDSDSAAAGETITVALPEMTSVIGGFTISATTGNMASVGGSATWTNVTEDYEDIPSTLTIASGASIANGATTITPSVAFNVGGAELVIVGATF